MDKANTYLSPITELSDIDQSGILSQLSSVSGEISEKTLEELLRDCDNDIPSLSWCQNLVKKSSNEAIINSNSSEQIQDELDLPCPNSKVEPSSNIFKNAIDSLTEITNFMQAKLTLANNDSMMKHETKPLSKLTKSVPNDQIADGSLTYRPNRASLIRRDITNVRISNLYAPGGLNLFTKSNQSGNFSKKKNEQRKVAIPKQVISRQSSLNAAARIYGNAKSAERIDIRSKGISSLNSPVPKSSSSNLKNAKNKPAGGRNYVHSAGSSEVIQQPRRGSGSAGFRANGSGRGSDPARARISHNLQQQDQPTSGLKPRASKSAISLGSQWDDSEKRGRSLSARSDLKSGRTAWSAAADDAGSRTFRLSDGVGESVTRSESEDSLSVSQQIRSFEHQLASIEEKYKEQLNELRENCERLEAAQMANLHKISKQCSEVERVNSCDFGTQTAIKTSEIACETSPRPGQQIADNVNAVGVGSAALNNVYTDLDSVPEKIPKLNLGKINNSKSSRRPNIAVSTRSFMSARCQPEQKSLYATIRSLQTELDASKKLNQKLTVQLTGYNKLRETERLRYGLRRTVGTQTTDNVIHHETINDAEYLALKSRVEAMEKEIFALQEKRLLDLRTLQLKHEEEVKALLNEKLSVSKQLQAFQSWERFW